MDVTTTRLHIRDQHEGLVLTLKAHAAAERSSQVPEVQPAGGPVAGEQAGFVRSIHVMAPTVAAQQRAAPDKQNPLLSKGTRGDSRGATQVRPRLPHQQKNLPVIATGFGRPASLCGYAQRVKRRLIPSAVITVAVPAWANWLVAVRPRNSEVHSASALVLGLHHLLPGSLAAALKLTRPLQRCSL